MKIYHTAEVPVGPSGLLVPVELEVQYSAPSQGYHHNDPGELYWDDYKRLDGLRQHGGVADAIDIWFDAHVDDVAEAAAEQSFDPEPEY